MSCKNLFSNGYRKLRKISFYYRRNGVLRDHATTVSPFHLVISAGRYYMLYNKDETENVSPYRLDRIENIRIENHLPARKIKTLQEVGQPFYLKQYMKEHPRMSFENTISVTMLVSFGMMEAVRTEFRVNSMIWISDEEKYRVRITSTKTAICNWVINVTDQIIIESSSDETIFDVLRERVRNIMEGYRV